MSESQVVLVVEDDASFRKLMEVMLIATLGIRVVLAGDGKEALEQLQKVKPALVLLDLSIPETDGMELVRQLKAHPATKSVPLIAVTAMSEAREKAMAAGCDDFVEKPFQLDFLIDKVRHYLDG